jgi:hypothetical protein
MGQTLFDVAAITDLGPYGGVIDPSISINTSFSPRKIPNSFTKFIETFHESDPEISDEEHIAFLLFCLCSCFLYRVCSRKQKSYFYGHSIA